MENRGFYYRKAELHRAGNPGVFEEEYAGVSIKTICGRRNLRLSGKSLCLKVKEAETERVETDETYLYLYLKQTENFTKKERLVQQWFKEQTVQVFSEIIESIYPQFEKYGVPYPKITIRSMTSRWGSCQPVKARITLNAWLIATPKECIEYVVVHEFAHFIHPNHSKQFWAFVESMMPDYRERKTMLRGYGTR